MANQQKSDEQDKQKLPSRDEKTEASQQRDKSKSADPQPGSDAPLDPEDAAFIKKNR
jgi:hypothetical protein